MPRTTTGRWEWEPERCVNVDFAMRADDLLDKGIPNMVAAVARILAGRGADAALVQNGNYLLLIHTGGELREHRTTWWDHYGVGNILAL
ncbi:hypothetical protein GCM10027290_05830 [Micromonospora sonneratiae]